MTLQLKQVVGGRYRIDDVVGQGGMQKVWKAHDLRLNRDVAVKVPISKSATKRFMESARLSAKVRHSNVAVVLDYLSDDSGEYYVEELIPGVNLQDCMDKSFPRLDADTCAMVMHHLAKGVAASHRVRVVHRDLKPSNVMVGADLSFRAVKITDFGIAKLAQSQIDSEALRMNETNQTEGLTSTMLGAIPFLAPEVLRKGKPGVGPASFGSDVWSLGAMGYWLLSGIYPFDTGFDAVGNILAGKLTPWSPVIASNRMTTELARNLQRIIEGCLVVDPNARPSAEVLAEQLGRLGYFTGKRECGVVRFAGQYGGVWKGLSDSGQPIMLHNHEVMAGSQVKIGSRISYIACPGRPDPRAFAIIKLKDA